MTPSANCGQALHVKEAELALGHAQRAVRHLQGRLTQDAARLINYENEAHLYPRHISAKRTSTTRERLSMWRERLQEAEALFAARQVVAHAAQLTCGTASGSPAAPAYTAVSSRQLRDGTWEAGGPVLLSAERAEDLLKAWERTRGAQVEPGAHGAFTFTAPDRAIDLHPIAGPTPTEGDVLRSALAAYGLFSHQGGEGGASFVIVPLNGSTEHDVWTSARLLIASGEDAERPLAEHDEPWSVHLYDEGGEYVDEVYVADLSEGIAQESAECAAFIASWLRAYASLDVSS
ncbi:hypothetical protein [Streptomyces sp. NPDC059003]|uniref:hypothetical protein n=1 Tax=Streptomyces sp. NPDC059003 TaxID=3346691 RepID=UPI0036C13B7F